MLTRSGVGCSRGSRSKAAVDMSIELRGFFFFAEKQEKEQAEVKRRVASEKRQIESSFLTHANMYSICTTRHNSQNQIPLEKLQTSSIGPNGTNRHGERKRGRETRALRPSKSKHPHLIRSYPKRANQNTPKTATSIIYSTI